jgi:glycerophosphoryl diester phosphodiesterase
MIKSILYTLLTFSATAFLLHAEDAPSKTNKSNWNVVDHVPVGSIVVQSHRGAGVLAEENTISAFELGWKMGTVPESDLRTTSDGIIVAFHDDNFKRVVKGASLELQKKGVKDLTFEELSKLDVGSWKGDNFTGRHVSKITEVLDIMKGRPERHLYMDIKNVDLKQLAREVLTRGIGKQVTLASPKHEIIREWKRLVPESDTLLWMGGDEKAMQENLANIRKNNFEGITQLQAHIHLNKEKGSSEPFVPSTQFIINLGEELRSHQILFQTLPWGISDPDVYSKLMDLGVASFATDHPDVTMQAIKNHYEKKKGLSGT